MGRFSDIARDRAKKASKVAERPAWWTPMMVVVGVVFGVALLFKLMSGPDTPAPSANAGQSGGPVIVTFAPDGNNSGTAPPGTRPPGPRSDGTRPSGTGTEPVVTPGGDDPGEVTGTTVVVNGSLVSLLGPGSKVVDVPAAAYERAQALVKASDPTAKITGAIATAVSSSTVTFSLTVEGNDSPVRASVSVDPTGNWVGFLA